jgi:hypothetical protein
MRYRQVELRSDCTTLVANVSDRPRLAIGNELTLRDHGDPARRWRIVWVAEHSREASEIKSRWRVGGLL